MSQPSEEVRMMYDALSQSWARLVSAARAKEIEVAAAYEDARAGRSAGPGQALLLECERLRHLKEAERAKLDAFLKEHFG